VCAAAFEAYSTFGGRRFMTGSREATAKGSLAKTPHVNSIFNYLERDDLIPLLHDLVTASSLPLTALETDVSVESSGFSSCRYTGWFDTTHGDMPMEQHDWKKLHRICGVTTNVMTSVEVTEGTAGDASLLPPTRGRNRADFAVADVSADKAVQQQA
jgi:hypothetical protein